MESRSLTFTMLKFFIIAQLLLLLTVQVNGRPEIFLSVTGLKQVNATLGENITLPCRFQTDESMEVTSMTLSWSKDGKIKWTLKLNLNDESQLEKLSKGIADFHLVHIQREDAGSYICSITYLELEKNLTTTVFVKDGDEDDPNLSILLPTTSNTTIPVFDKYRKEKIGIVVGVLAFVNCLAFVIFFCVTA